ncbi:hypothetical protein K504DRAFT_507227 [Pleomassaria siparia CBS 279.74]|uniref:Zn(2)-C6 fungal-type domain-containing protein n=1 Tax=Pleomassaria siparia CBS 279.74 TaxID=1314801 RepID=A0A6G1JUC9_9PLEO|nr:hypothetical protein K504DRAFT_507227 [Pleomassaria siparia CBS 279.74]
MADLFPTSSVSPPTTTTTAAHTGSASAVSGKKAHHTQQPRIRRRNRLITSCLECRRRKLKCDKQQPCTNCTKSARQCVFIAPGLDPEAQARLAEVKEKMGMLERTLEKDVARRSSSKSASGSAIGSLDTPVLPGQEGPHSEEEEEDTRDLETNRLSTEDAAYYEDEGNDDIVDLGISMGKLRITERIGGFVRPKFSEELAQALKYIPKTNTQNPFSAEGQSSWMSPSPNYVAPTSSFFFAPGVEKTTLMNYLPAKVLVDKLIAHYWDAVHVIARMVHRPSFERQYEAFWDNVSNGVEPRISFQAVVFAALLSSVISMSEEKVLKDFGVGKHGLVDNFKQGTESALARANFLRTTKLETLQAFVMYLIPLCRAEVSRAHSALTGTVIRLAECMGLHRDPSQWSSSPVEIHLRRLIWYQICFLDLRTCEATGPRPQIRREEYDTKFPLNVEDADLERENPPTTDANYFTDMTITRMRLECYEMHRLLWIERPKLETKKITLTSLLSRIQAFKAAMEKTYLPMFNKTVPLHVVAMEMYGILSDRLYIMILQKFASSDRLRMPERLRDILISTCVLILEHSMAIEEQPALASWAWYVGALHQYHTSLLLLSEMYSGRRDEIVEARVWRCLDYVFDLPAGLLGLEKCRFLLEELVGRTSMFQHLRRTRAPTNMPAPGQRTYNVEETRRQSEPEIHEKSVSAVPGSSGFAAVNSNSNSTMEPGPSQAQPRPPDAHFVGRLANIANMDFVNMDIGTPSLSADPTGATGPYNFSDYPPPGPPPGMISAGNGNSNVNIAPTLSPGHTGDSSGGHAPMAGATGGSPMDAIPDIDWNEWERLFGGAEMSAGNIFIPPYTFPQFEPGELQWPTRGGSCLQ